MLGGPKDRIATLEGQRIGEMNLKRDLLRRIKMLEHVLRQERAARTGDAVPTAGAAGYSPGAAAVMTGSDGEAAGAPKARVGGKKIKEGASRRASC